MSEPSREELVSAWIDGELDPETSRQVEALMAADPALRELADSLQGLSRRFRALPPVAARDGLAQGIMRRIREEFPESENRAGSAGPLAARKELADEGADGIRRSGAWRWAGAMLAIAAALTGVVLWYPGAIRERGHGGVSRAPAESRPDAAAAPRASGSQAAEGHLPPAGGLGDASELSAAEAMAGGGRGAGPGSGERDSADRFLREEPRESSQQLAWADSAGDRRQVADPRLLPGNQAAEAAPPAAVVMAPPAPLNDEESRELESQPAPRRIAEAGEAGRGEQVRGDAGNLLGAAMDAGGESGAGGLDDGRQRPEGVAPGADVSAEPAPVAPGEAGPGGLGSARAAAMPDPDAMSNVLIVAGPSIHPELIRAVDPGSRKLQAVVGDGAADADATVYLFGGSDAEWSAERQRINRLVPESGQWTSEDHAVQLLARGIFREIHVPLHAPKAGEASGESAMGYGAGLQSGQAGRSVDAGEPASSPEAAPRWQLVARVHLPSDHAANPANLDNQPQVQSGAGAATLRSDSPGLSGGGDASRRRGAVDGWAVRNLETFIASRAAELDAGAAAAAAGQMAEKLDDADSRSGRVGPADRSGRWMIVIPAPRATSPALPGGR